MASILNINVGQKFSRCLKNNDLHATLSWYGGNWNEEIGEIA